MSSSLVVDQRPVSATATRADIALGLRRALNSGTGFAAGKLGVSEQALLAYPFLLERCTNARQSAALTVQTRQHCQTQMGVFPVDQEYLIDLAHFHAEATRQLDVLGLVNARLESDLIRELRLPAARLSLLELEPDRSIPDNSRNCYLPELAGQRVLLISSIAELLRSQADRDTFERVWAKTGKPWFAPASVTALEFPYTYDQDTQRRFGTSRNLLDWILERIDPDRFDVALIAGSHLGIPMAAAIRSMNRSAVALGGSLQVLFGVNGKRWREDADWQRDYITDAWVDVPQSYVPHVTTELVDDGAYW